MCIILYRFTNPEDRDWFINNLLREARLQLKDNVDDIQDEETFWVDFLREPPDVTGDEPEDFDYNAPKIYEEVPSWQFLIDKLNSIYLFNLNNAIN